MQWPAWASQLEWEKKGPPNAEFMLYASYFASIWVTPEQRQQGVCFLGKHYVCPGAQRIGKEVRREVQWCFPCYFGLASLKTGKKICWHEVTVCNYCLKENGEENSKICGANKQLFLGLRSLISLFWQNGLRLKAYFVLWIEDKYHQDPKGIVKYFP